MAGKLTFNREATPMQKADLIAGSYYIGVSRNAQVARWTGSEFRHWREKWGTQFIDTLKHRDDEDVFDVFDAWMRVDNEYQVREIPL